MTNFEDFRIGDRVQAVSRDEEPDTAEFTVTGIQPLSRRLLSRFSVYGTADYTFSLLHRPAPPLPTVPGVYGLGEPGTMYMVLTTEYGWFWLDFTSPDLNAQPIPESELDRFADRMVLMYAHGSEHKS